MKLIFCGGCLLWLGTPTGAQAQTRLKFIENKNQWPEHVDFVSRIPGGKMFVSAGSLRYYFIDYQKFEELHHQSHQGQPDGPEVDHRIRGHALFVDFPGANALAEPQGIARSDEYYNYFLGDDPRHWASKAFAYEGMLYQSFYPGVDLKIYSAGENLKYDFVLAAYADPSVIRMHYKGANKMYLENGDLHIETSLANIIERNPVAWQVVNGEKMEVKCEFRLEGDIVSFLFPEGFDSCHELVIDPLLIFSTFSGSTADNWGSTATPGEHGKLYSAGVTNEGNGGVFPATEGAFQTTSGGFFDIGILKYDSLGGDLLYATYLGGSQAESPHSLIMNAAGELVLLGSTSSSDFVTTANAFDRTFNGGPQIPWVVGYDYSAGSDIVISRFSADGTQLLASTFVGGVNNDGLNSRFGELSKNYGDQVRGDIITDEEGNIYVSSVTASTDFPAVNSFSTTYGGGESDAILFKMDPDLSQILWGTFIGGSGTDAAHTLKFDKLNNIFLAGGTTSGNFPVTTLAFQPAYAGGVDGWIAKVASDGSAILHCTYTGTPNYNQIYFLDLNTDEEVYVYGQTSGSFPVSAGVYSNPNSGQFIQKFTHTLNARLFSTVFGSGRGIPDISPTAFLVNDCNNLYMAGWGGAINGGMGYWQSDTHGMTTTPDAFQQTTSGSDFYFIVLTEDAKERLYATFLGGTQSRTHVDGGTSRFDKGGIVYHSVCSGCSAFNPAEQATSDFPTTAGAWSRTNKSVNCNNAAFKFDLSSLKARIQTNSAKRDMPGLKVVCIPDPIVFENVSIGGEIFQWDLGDGTRISKTDTAYISHQYESPGQYTVTLTAIDRGTCRAVDITSTIVTVNMAQSTVQEDADVCFGDAHELQASGGIIYTWTTDDPNFISGDATPVVTPEDTTAYYLRLEEENGCIRRDTVQLNVIPSINADFEWNKEADCLARPAIMVRNLTDSVDSSDLMFFDFGDGTTADYPEGEHEFEKDGVYIIRLVTQREFCVYEKVVTVPVFEMLIPNVITPGQPGHNDVFTIRYGRNEGVTPQDYGFNVSVTIFNRWGRMVYQSDHYQYDWSGEGLAAGTYYYEVAIEGHATCRSWVQLVK